MSTWRVYNAIAECETDSDKFDPEFPWYVALDTGAMTFEIDVRFPSEPRARMFLRWEVVGADVENSNG